jgi:hypothetical protein
MQFQRPHMLQRPSVILGQTVEAARSAENLRDNIPWPDTLRCVAMQGTPQMQLQGVKARYAARRELAENLRYASCTPFRRE